MKLLLTAECIHNESIERALQDILPRPSQQCTAVYITTSQNAATGDKAWYIENLNNAYNVGWRSFEIIDVAAMIDLPKDRWWSRMEAADVIFMGGGANFYLGYWLERSGLAEVLPHLLQHKVYVGCSAGSMVTTKSLITASQSMRCLAKGENFLPDELDLNGQSSPRSLGIVDFAIRPHYTSSNYPYITDGLLQQAANMARCRVYALDNDSALKVVDNEVEIISEGQYKVFDPASV